MIGQQIFYKKRCLKNVLISFLLILFILTSCRNKESISASDVIILINSNTSSKSVAIEKVAPYLDHFGVKFSIVDIIKEGFPSEKVNPALIIIGHSEITSDNNNELAVKLENYLNTMQLHGVGILSFDPLMPNTLLSHSGNAAEKDYDVGELRFSSKDHYITGYRQANESQDLLGYMSIPKMSVKEGKALIKGNDLPLLVVSDRQNGKVSQWTSPDWMYYSILGPLGGLDDCLWKSIVWTARKPFVMQALPPIATFRIDDVLGIGRQQWDESPFQWVKTTNKYGFKPWLGLFNFNISPEGVEELKELMQAGLATGTPHALGRPPRKESGRRFIPDYWYPDVPFNYLSDYYDEFIFFDHNNERPWPDDTVKMIFQAVDDWYLETGLPMGKYLVPHWGEIGSNMISHMHDKWDIEFTSIREVDKSWGQQTPEYNLKQGEQPVRNAPFRIYDEPVIGKEKENVTTSRASYNVEFKDFAGYKFFDFSSIINDITGYEWMPDNNVEKTADRGIKTLSRGLEAKALAMLFTHETDYIYDIKPDNWDAIFRIISEGISKYNPALLTTEDALQILRSFHTSEIQNCIHNENTGELTISMIGETDVPTSVFVYTNDGEKIVEKLVEIPVFQNELTQVIQLTEY